jgi:hypothetical protein
MASIQSVHAIVYSARLAPQRTISIALSGQLLNMPAPLVVIFGEYLHGMPGAKIYPPYFTGPGLLHKDAIITGYSIYYKGVSGARIVSNEYLLTNLVISE